MHNETEDIKKITTKYTNKATNTGREVGFLGVPLRQWWNDKRRGRHLVTDV